MNDNGAIQRAVSDLAMIRKAIERARGNVKPDKAYWPAMKAKMMVQSISLVFALAVLLARHSRWYDARVPGKRVGGSPWRSRLTSSPRSTTAARPAR